MKYSNVVFIVAVCVALIQLTCGQNENTTVEAAPTTVTSEADASSTITTTLSTTTMGAAQISVAFGVLLSALLAAVFVRY